jgi:hypothetical protein
MIPPYISAASLHAERRAAAFFNITSMSMPAMAALIIRTANRNGVIRLTLTA